MTGGTLYRRSLAGLVAGSLVIAFLGGCGTDGSEASVKSTTSPVTTDVSSDPVESAAGSTTSPTKPPPTDQPALDPPVLDVIASLGYPRDLQERGRVNLKISRPDDVEMVVLDKQLVTDFFLPSPVEERRSTIPGAGRVVALQTLFGTVDNCDNPSPVTAVVELTYSYGDEPSPRHDAFEIADTAVLDEIRFQDCTVRRVLETTTIEFGVPTIIDETVTVDLTITRIDGTDEFAIDAIKGTVLFGASTPFESGAPERTLRADADRLTLPLTFDVNRCDSHAVAETTKKFGLDLYVAVNGAESQRVPIEIAPIQSDLEIVLERCTARTGQ